MNRSLSFYLLLILLLFLGMGGFVGGGMLLIQPNGSLLGMSAEWLAHSPFRTYRIPGIILFLFNGLFPLFTVVGLLLNPEWKWADVLNIYRNRQWPWTYSL